jgi:starch phosphorylase
MEVAVSPSIPTYAGGLGVLAGDTLQTAADVGLSMVGVTLLYRQGYFRQRLDAHGRQTEQPVVWSPETQLDALPTRSLVTIEGRTVHLRVWRHRFHGVGGHEVPLYFLDTALAENDPWDRELTGALYGRGEHYRLCQEVVLGVGGLAMLRALGHQRIATYHMNEGHAALLPLALLLEEIGAADVRDATDEHRAAVQSRCVFTTHTPVEPGHDRFSFELVAQVIGPEAPLYLAAQRHAHEGMLNMSYLALAYAHYVNAVSMRHRRTSHELFPGYAIHSVTNGVHAASWTCPPVAALYDAYAPGWRADNLYLRNAISVPVAEVLDAHGQAKEELMARAERRSGVQLDPTVFTIGFARRASVYKRADFVLSDLGRLERIVERVGPLQMIYGGKAHPNDELGKAIIERIFVARAALGDKLRLAYLEEYDLSLGRSLCAGVDLWLNTPEKPLEASGTSGMKAALNGVPSLSILDGWWTEGHVEGVTGWAIGDSVEPDDPARELTSLYDKLEFLITPTFYRQPFAYAEVMRGAMALNGSYFNTQRMLAQYVRNAYARPQDGQPG